MNDVALTGRLTNDPIIYQNDDPKRQAAHFFLAVKKLGKRQEGDDTSFIPCVVFGKRGEHLRKGMLIGIAGWIDTSRREKGDGTIDYLWEIMVRDMDFLEPKKNSENQDSTDGYNDNQGGQNNYQSDNNQNNYPNQDNRNGNNRPNNNRGSGGNRNGNNSRGNASNSSGRQGNQKPANAPNQTPYNGRNNGGNQGGRRGSGPMNRELQGNYNPNYDDNYPMEQENWNDDPYRESGYNDNPYAKAYEDRYNSGNQAAFDGDDQFNQGM